MGAGEGGRKKEEKENSEILRYNARTSPWEMKDPRNPRSSSSVVARSKRAYSSADFLAPAGVIR